MKNIFTEHPHSLNETYFQHLKYAGTCGLTMIIAGTALLIHALFPFVFQKIGIDSLVKMIREYISRMTKPEDRILRISTDIEERFSK